MDRPTDRQLVPTAYSSDDDKAELSSPLGSSFVKTRIKRNPHNTREVPYIYIYIHTAIILSAYRAENFTPDTKTERGKRRII